MSKRVTHRMSPFARRVLDVVERIPHGRVLTYGDVSDLLGESSARGVGVVMSQWGEEVPWWRVLNADGRPAALGDPSATDRLRHEGVTFTSTGRVDLGVARWDGQGWLASNRSEEGQLHPLVLPHPSQT